jgi:hypothetical protein
VPVVTAPALESLSNLRRSIRGIVNPPWSFLDWWSRLCAGSFPAVVYDA